MAKISADIRPGRSHFLDVRIPSVYRPGSADGNEEKAAHFVVDYLRKLGIKIHVEEAAPKRPNFV